MLYTIVIIFLILKGIFWILGKQRVGNYEEKWVFITGCDTGFGNLLAKRLDQLGFHVFAGCLTDTGAERLQRECSSRLITLALDVTNETSIAMAVDTVKKAIPRDKGLWALVNNAGIGGTAVPVEWQTRDVYEKVLAVNLYGVIDVTKAFLPLLRRSQGRIVNMASIAGRIGVRFAPYSISKFGVEGYSDCLRHELYTTGVSVHIIEPGFFATDILSGGQLRQSWETSYQSLDEERREYYGPEYAEESITRSMRFVNMTKSTRLGDVVDVYEHAVTSKYPKIRYVVGSFTLVFLFRLSMLLPEWTYTGVLGRARPIPKGLQNPSQLRTEKAYILSNGSNEDSELP